MDITEVITSLGFPAAVAAFALWNSYNHEQFLQTTLKESIQENTKVLISVKEALSSLKDAIERGETNDKG